MIAAADTPAPIPAWVGGVLTPVDKLDAHHRGLRHKAVSVFVMHGGALLLQRRALGKYHTPGLWANTCCTHPHWQEPAADCARRRLRQELGIEGLDCEYRHRLEYRAEVGNGMIEHEVVDLFLARCDSRPDVRENPDEVMDHRWITASDLHREIEQRPAAFTPWLRIYLHEHGAQVLPGF